VLATEQVSTAGDGDGEDDDDFLRNSLRSALRMPPSLSDSRLDILLRFSDLNAQQTGLKPFCEFAVPALMKRSEEKKNVTSFTLRNLS
jgi:hypothetical protein